MVITIGKFTRVTLRRGGFFFVEIAGIKNGAFTGVSGEVFDERLATTHPFSQLAKARVAQPDSDSGQRAMRRRRKVRSVVECDAHTRCRQREGSISQRMRVKRIV